MTEVYREDHPEYGDSAPGDERLDGSGVAQGIAGYLVGLVLALGLTGASFYFAAGHALWAPGIAPSLVALAVGQMGVHLVFFLHITTGPESTNNVLALAFGVLIVFLLIAGTLFIMSTLNHNMPQMGEIISMQR
ncbi:MAG TPA: cytochrome o ubiquinol oxidase subunit IV [Caulobacteraceae bacterium]|jgi:cytochrome o ubiquinol oxidase operon protein cyoD